VSRWLQPTLVPRSRIVSSTLNIEAIRSSETSVYTISTRCHIPEDGILHRKTKLVTKIEGLMINSSKSVFHFNKTGNTGKPQYVRFRSMRISVNTVTNICIIPLLVFVPPQIF
jgi:hypothetical protein